MNEIVKSIIAAIGIVSLLSSIPFYLGLMSGAIRIYQGDYNATQDMAEDFADEVTGTLIWTAVIAILIAFATALGLTGLVAILRKV
jgi:hypothetical protein